MTNQKETQMRPFSFHPLALLAALTSGLVFGLGLILSGMTNPWKVRHFLDLAGPWDPSLAFVMMGAIPVTFFGYRLIENRQQTVLSAPLHLPGTRIITWPLVLGSLMFGAGWALAGFCPGPALAAVGAGMKPAIVFLAAMVVGMILHDRVYLPRTKAHRH